MKMVGKIVIQWLVTSRGFSLDCRDRRPRYEIVSQLRNWSSRAGMWPDEKRRTQAVTHKARDKDEFCPVTTSRICVTFNTSERVRSLPSHLPASSVCRGTHAVAHGNVIVENNRAREANDDDDDEEKPAKGRGKDPRASSREHHCPL